VIRLDYISCALTVTSTILVGMKRWEGWIFASLNSVIICVIAVKTSQIGFIPANLFCLLLYAGNVRHWCKNDQVGMSRLPARLRDRLMLKLWGKEATV
jgi:hypothetical protein